MASPRSDGDGDGVVLGFSHVAVGVRDMDRSVAFYRDVVGLTVSVDALEPQPGRHLRRAVYMRWSDSSRDGFLVLDQNVEVEAPSSVSELYALGIHHFAFLVDDVDAAQDRAMRFGSDILFRSVEPAVRYGEEVATEEVDTLLVRDPDGNVVQFDTWLG